MAVMPPQTTPRSTGRAATGERAVVRQELSAKAAEMLLR